MRSTLELIVHYCGNALDGKCSKTNYGNVILFQVTRQLAHALYHTLCNKDVISEKIRCAKASFNEILNKA